MEKLDFEIVERIQRSTTLFECRGCEYNSVLVWNNYQNCSSVTAYKFSESSAQLELHNQLPQVPGSHTSPSTTLLKMLGNQTRHSRPVSPTKHQGGTSLVEIQNAHSKLWVSSDLTTGSTAQAGQPANATSITVTTTADNDQLANAVVFDCISLLWKYFC